MTPNREQWRAADDTRVVLCRDDGGGRCRGVSHDKLAGPIVPLTERDRDWQPSVGSCWGGVKSSSTGDSNEKPPANPIEQRCPACDGTGFPAARRPRSRAAECIRRRARNARQGTNTKGGQLRPRMCPYTINEKLKLTAGAVASLVIVG